MELKAAEIKKEYRFSNETGDAQIDIYQIFPGIEAAFISIHMAHFDFSDFEGVYRENYVGFHYCKEGRIEQEANGEFIYLMPGDLSVVMQDKAFKKFSFPLSHYHGISIGINTDIPGNPFADFLGSNAVTPIHVARHICGNRINAILRDQYQLEHILGECYTIQDSQRVDYLKIKIMELLFVLSQTTPDAHLVETTVPRIQAELVKEVAAFLSDHIEGKIAIKDLTGRFGVSETNLQKAFRAVYGMPIISFIRVQKMQCAAQELIHTNRSVDDIAEQFGYINESKFSAVFKKIMGDPPSVYRKEHTKIKIV